MFMGLTGGIGLLACALAIYFSTRAAARGTLPRGTGVGIKTATTQRSDAAWVAGHQAALPCARLVSTIAALFALALIVAGAMSGPTDTNVAVVLLFVIGYGVVLASAYFLVRAANRGALAAVGHSER